MRLQTIIFGVIRQSINILCTPATCQIVQKYHIITGFACSAKCHTLANNNIVNFIRWITIIVSTRLAIRNKRCVRRFGTGKRIVRIFRIGFGVNFWSFLKCRRIDLLADICVGHVAVSVRHLEVEIVFELVFRALVEGLVM